MGNHIVGKMFNAGVSVFTEEEIDNMSQEKAIEVIKKIGKKVVESTSLDAEFDDYMNPCEPLGRILIKAFIPEKYDDWKHEEYVSDDMGDMWYDNLEKPFREMFGFW